MSPNDLAPCVGVPLCDYGDIIQLWLLKRRFCGPYATFQNFRFLINNSSCVDLVVKLGLYHKLMCAVKINQLSQGARVGMQRWMLVVRGSAVREGGYFDRCELTPSTT